MSSAADELAGTQGDAVAGPQAAPAVAPQPTPSAAPPILDAEQRALLQAVLNRIVPARPDANLPGAGDLDVTSSIERTLAVSAKLRRLFLDGLATIAVSTPETPFINLDLAQQTALLQQVEQRSPAFFVALVEHTYRGYYTHPIVCAALGEGARIPQPHGHQLEPFNPNLLLQQRQRAPFWRPAPD
jgi:hypothetical protein